MAVPSGAEVMSTLPPCLAARRCRLVSPMPWPAAWAGVKPQPLSRHRELAWQLCQRDVYVGRLGIAGRQAVAFPEHQHQVTLLIHGQSAGCVGRPRIEGVAHAPQHPVSNLSQMGGQISPSISCLCQPDYVPHRNPVWRAVSRISPSSCRSSHRGPGQGVASVMRTTRPDRCQFHHADPGKCASAAPPVPGGGPAFRRIKACQCRQRRNQRLSGPPAQPAAECPVRCCLPLSSAASQQGFPPFRQLRQPVGQFTISALLA